MHVEGHGEPTNLAETMKTALAQTGTPLTQPSGIPQSSAFDWSKVEDIMGQQGHRSGNLLQFNISRPETITENNVVIPPFMGVASPINFQTVGKKAATTGDFVLLANEVNPVVQALAEHSINVTAIQFIITCWLNLRDFSSCISGSMMILKIGSGSESCFGKDELCKRK